MLIQEKEVDIGKIVREQIKLAVSEVQSEGVDFVVLKDETKESADKPRVYFSHSGFDFIQKSGKLNYEKLFDYLGENVSVRQDYAYSSQEKDPILNQEQTGNTDYSLAKDIVKNNFLAKIIAGNGFTQSVNPGLVGNWFSSPDEKEKFVLWSILTENKMWNMVTYGLVGS